MGIGSQAGATVRLEIIILDGKAALAMRRLDRGITRTSRSVGRANRRFIRMGSIFATITKALISMVAVLIVFNLLITLPQRLFQAFVVTLQAAIRTVSQFEQRILALQAILASTVRFTANPLENFVTAGRVAAAVVEALALRANEMVISLEEAVIVFQTLVATGAQEMVEDMGQLVDLTILLGNAIAGITVGQQRQRQLAEETRSLMTGQLRATSLLGRLLFQSSTELNKFNKEMRISRNLSAEMQDKLLGFALAAKDFARTFEGLTTTFQTFLQLLAKRTFGGIFLTLETQISSVFDTILRENQGLFNLLAANIAASLRTIGEALKGIITDELGIEFDSVEDFFLRLIDLIPKATAKILVLIFTLRSIITVILSLVQAVRAVFNFVSSLLGLGFDTIFGGLSSLIDAGIERILDSTLGAAGRFLNRLFTVMGNAIEEALSNTFGEIGKFIGVGLGAAFRAVGGQMESEFSTLAKTMSDKAKKLMDNFVEVIGETDTLNIFATILDKVFGIKADELSGRLRETFEEVADLLGSSLGLIVKFLQSQSASAEAAKLLALFQGKAAEELQRINKEQALIAAAQQALNRLRRIDLQELIDINKEHLKTNRLIRSELSTLRELLRLSKSGQLAAVTGTNLVPNVEDARLRALESIRVLQRDLLTAKFRLQRAKLPGAFGPTEEQIAALEQDLIRIRSAINATEGDLIGLNQIFIDMANTTFPALAQAIADIAAGDLFRQFSNFFQLFKDGAKGFEFDVASVLKSIKDFVFSAQFLLQVIGAVGQGLAQAITNAFSGLKGFGQTLKEIFGSFITLIGQAIVQLGVAMVAVGIIGAMLGVPKSGEMIIAGLKAIAVGTGLIALGVALSGGGGAGVTAGGATGEAKVPTFEFEQSLVDVQQTFVKATERLDNSSANLDAVTSTFSSMPPKEVVMTGNNQMGGASQVLAIDLEKGTSATGNRRVARALQGGSS